MMRLVCRTPTGHFAAAVSANTLDEALQQRPDWMPVDGTFSLEPIETNPFLTKSIAWLLWYLDRMSHLVSDE